MAVVAVVEFVPLVETVDGSTSQMFMIGYREGSSPILRKTNVKVVLMGDYEMLYLKSPHFQVCARFRA